MRGDQAIELLPWLLNGTLGEDEGRAVRQHLTACPSCQEALAANRQAWEIFDQHIPAADLVAYAADTAGEGSDETLAEHLASCPECAAELELVRTSRALAEDDTVAVLAPRPPRAAAPPASANRARPAATRWKAAALAAGLAGLIAANGWYQTAERARTLAGRLLADASTPVAAPSAPPAAEVSPQDRQNVAALQSQLESMQKTLSELQSAEAEHRQQLSQIAEVRPVPGLQTGPQINTWVGDAREGGDVVRGSNDALEVPAGAAMATLILRPTGETQGGRDLEIADAQGKVVWQAQGLRLDPASQDYSVTFHHGDLAPGDYVIRLYRKENGQRAAAESYPIRVK
jgi:anti-sigma factor RsiW